MSDTPVDDRHWSVSRFFMAIFTIFLDVGFFWVGRLERWWHSQPREKQLVEALERARTYEAWEETAYQLDELLDADLWRQNAKSKAYDYRLIQKRLDAIVEAREQDDIVTLADLLRSGLVRNLVNITSPELFNRAYGGTKLLIDDYVTQVALAIQYMSTLPTNPIHHSGFTSQAKLELLHDTRQAFGRSTLVLQGGAIFGLCHLGVVKALHLKGLLPRIITGTATGALIAALVGIHTEDELLEFLNGDRIDLTAFDRRAKATASHVRSSRLLDDSAGWLQTVLRRVRRYIREGYFLDVNVLEECVRANVGNITFEEAYARTKRILNITVATSGNDGFPNLLNYLTAPNVLIWSAALASNASSTAFYSPVKLYCKDDTGAIIPWPSAQKVTIHSWRQARYNHDQESPLSRLAELFNVNHFIVSQARPYLAPFLRSDLQRPDQRKANRYNITYPLLRLLRGEIHHRLKQLDYLGLVPISIRRLLIDEAIPGTSLTLVPDLAPSDLTKLLANPTKDAVDHWIQRGEKCVWPSVAALRIRCAVEIELDRGYQIVRRRKVEDTPPDEGVGILSSGLGLMEKRPRSSSSSQF